MPLTPGEGDRLLLALEAHLAQRRRDRGLLLNVPEARALLADAVCEWARDGLTMPEVKDRAQSFLTLDDVLPGVPEALGEVRVEARFDDGTRLVVVKDPFGGATGGDADEAQEVPATGSLIIANESATAIGLTSHIHLAEVNPRLRVDRSAAFGMRLAIPTGASVWIRPGEALTLPIRPIGGARIAIGTSGAVEGALDDPAVRDRALQVLRACGYLDVVDGEPFGDATAAEGATAALVEHVRGERP